MEFRINKIKDFKMVNKGILGRYEGINVSYPSWDSPEKFRAAFVSYAVFTIGFGKIKIDENILLFIYETITGNELDLVIITKEPHKKADKIILSNINRDYKKHHYYISCRVNNFEEFKRLLSMHAKQFHIYSFSPAKINEEEVLKFCFGLYEKKEIIFNPEEEKIKEGIRFKVSIVKKNNFIRIEGNKRDIIGIFKDIVYNELHLKDCG